MKNLAFLTMAGLLALGAATHAGDVKQLPKPVITGGIALMDAIDQRESGRFYDTDKEIDDQTLSEILWVAWGANSQGKRTIPTARNLQNMNLYLLTPTGTWRYDGYKNCLEKVNDKNLITLCDTQPFVKDAKVHLLYTTVDDKWGRCHVGSAYQNVYLYATSKGLATVIRGLIDTEGLTRELGLKGDEKAILHQTVGWPLQD